MAEHGHYGGRTTPTDTRQGIYAAAPSGEFLASINHNDPARVAAMLEKALAAWDAMPREKRLPAAALEAAPVGRRRWEALYPADGLVLRVHTRDVDRGAGENADGRLRAWNLDFAWFRREEALAFVPGLGGARSASPSGGFSSAPKVGDRVPLPEAIVRRIARVNLVDDVRGQTPAFEDSAVEKATLSSEVAGVDGDRLRLRLEG